MKKRPHKKVAYLEEDNLLVFYCLSSSEIWTDKKSGLRWGGGGGGGGDYCIDYLHFNSNHIFTMR